MASDPVFVGSVVFATVTAFAGFVLGLLAWESFRGSPFGRMLGFLTVILFVLGAYHMLLLVVGQESILYLESIAFTALLGLIMLMLRLHHQLSRKPRTETDHGAG